MIGGAGTYAAVGARIVSGAEHSRSIGWIVDAGSDFPIQFRKTIESWNTSCLLREDKSRMTTRAWNGYGPDGQRGGYHSNQVTQNAISKLNAISLQIPDAQSAA